ncbi:hypothetical protein VTJ04DRAFT_4539 [Mycothermus thermophilus]|uniref:uncharacterized protein n=1 Tax=Humicola insolens TaxID=85995 RepID=UPI0037449460
MVQNDGQALSGLRQSNSTSRWQRGEKQPVMFLVEGGRASNKLSCSQSTRTHITCITSQLQHAEAIAEPHQLHTSSHRPSFSSHHRHQPWGMVRSLKLWSSGCVQRQKCAAVTPSSPFSLLLPILAEPLHANAEKTENKKTPDDP